MSDEIVDKLPPIFELLRLLFSYRFHCRACRRLIVSRRDSESNQKLGRVRRELLISPTMYSRLISYPIGPNSAAKLDRREAVLEVYLEHGSQHDQTQRERNRCDECPNHYAEPSDELNQ